jgi:hypothetical protein
MKKLKFSEPLPELILRGEKDITWRINDEKGIKVDDLLSLCHKDGKEFAKAKVTWIKEKTFGDLTEEDKEGHEEFSSDKEMYETYSKYYRMEVTPKTRLKVIKFSLLVGKTKKRKSIENQPKLTIN